RGRDSRTRTARTPELRQNEFWNFIFEFPLPYRLEESKGLGKRSFIQMVSVLPLRFASITGTSPQNSQINWRQAPQGGVRVSVSVTTEMALKPRSPSLMALRMATRSAQTVRPSVAFATLQSPQNLY